MTHDCDDRDSGATEDPLLGGLHPAVARRSRRSSTRQYPMSDYLAQKKGKHSNLLPDFSNEATRRALDFR